MFGAHGALAAENQPQSDAPGLRQRAEDLARAASQRFTEILDKKDQPASEASPMRADAGKAGSPTPYTRALDWLARSSKSYDDVVIAQLKSKDGWTTLVQSTGAADANADTHAPAASGPAPELRGWSGLVELLRYWLARANSAYRNDIVRPLREPSSGIAPGPIERAEQPKAAPAPITVIDSAELKRKQQAEEQVKREAEAADRQRHAEEARRAAEEDASRQRAADLQRRADEAKRLAAAAEEKRKAQAEARARLIAEAEERRKAEVEAKRKAQAEQKRLAAAEAKRKADAAEAQRKAEAEKKRAADAETKRQAEEADAAERRAVAQAEAEAKRQAEIDAEATRRSEAAARAKASARAGMAAQPVPPVTAPASSPSAAATPAAREPVKKAEGEKSPRSTVQENSAVAVAPSAPERKPELPQSSAKATPKKREEATVAEAAQSQPVKSGRQARRVEYKKHKRAAYAYAMPGKRHHHVYKAVHGKRGKAHVRKHRHHGGHAVFVKRGCRCVCGPLMHRPRKHHWGRVTHRHRVHYID